jgi:hypothetical protein
MSDADALKVAIELFHLPSQIRAMRALPLPKGTKLLLRLAVGDADAMREAQMLNDRPQFVIRQAAIFFIEQILLDPVADEYRTLGLDHAATTNELRAHMALLLKWLHPDLSSDDHRSAMARQAIQAWKKVNSSEKLRRRPAAIARIPTNGRHRRTGKSVAKHVPMQSTLPIARRTHKLRRILRIIAAAARNRFVHCKN